MPEPAVAFEPVLRSAEAEPETPAPLLPGAAPEVWPLVLDPLVPPVLPLAAGVLVVSPVALALGLMRWPASRAVSEKSPERIWMPCPLFSAVTALLESKSWLYFAFQSFLN